MADYPYVLPPGGDVASRIAAFGGAAVNAWNANQHYQTEKQLAQQQAQAGLLTRGLIQDPSDPSGSKVIRNPLAESQYQQDLAERDPNSEASQHLVNFAQTSLHQSGNHDLAGQLKPGENSGYEARQILSMAKPNITGQYGLVGKQQRYGLMQGNQAAHAADSFDKDHIINQLQTQQNQIQRDKHTLDNAPVLTPQIFQEIQLGIANAISGGKSASVSSADKTEYNSLDMDFTKLKQRLTNNPQDIGSPQVKEMLSGVMDRLNSAYQTNMAARAHQIAKGRQSAYGSNPAALQVLKDKESSYAPDQRPAGLLGKGSSPAAPNDTAEAAGGGFTSDVVNYAKTHGISNEQAMAIKQQRTGGK